MPIMAIFTATELAEQKTAWKAALLAVSTGKSYEIDGRSLTRANTNEIRATLEWLDEQEAAIAAESTGNAGVRTLISRVAR